MPLSVFLFSLVGEIKTRDILYLIMYSFGGFVIFPFNELFAERQRFWSIVIGYWHSLISKFDPSLAHLSNTSGEMSRRFFKHDDLKYHGNGKRDQNGRKLFAFTRKLHCFTEFRNCIQKRFCIFGRKCSPNFSKYDCNINNIK